MKKAILLSSVFAIGAAFATDVESGNAIGVLKFSTTDRSAVMLVAVPFAGYGSADCNVKVTDLISTAGLPDGTILRAASATENKYDAWRLESGKWTTIDVVEVDAAGRGKISNAGSAADKTIGRGNSVWLDFTNVAKPTEVTLLGQMPGSGSLALASGKWSLIGNPGVTSTFDLNTAIKNAGTRDQICVQDAAGNLKNYTYSSGKWKTRASDGKVKEVSSTDLIIKAGEGCWYFANGTERSFNF